MASINRKIKRERQRLSRKTKKALINSVGREQYHTLMSEVVHDASKSAKAEVFARVAQRPYSIRQGKVQRLLAYTNPMSNAG